MGERELRELVRTSRGLLTTASVPERGEVLVVRQWWDSFAESVAALPARESVSEPLEWYDKPDADESHILTPGVSPWWVAKLDVVLRPSEDWGLWLNHQHVARAKTEDAVKTVAQRLQDVIDAANDDE